MNPTSVVTPPEPVRFSPAMRRPLALILLVSVALRLLVAFYLGDTVPPAKDEQSYSFLAARVAQGHGFSFEDPWYPFAPADTPTAHWSFLYTGLIAAVYAAVGVHPLAVRLTGALAGGILLPVLVARLSLRVAPGRDRAALLSAAAAALYAYFILFAAQLMTETLFIAAVLWSLERAIALEHHLQSGERVPGRLGVVPGIALGVAVLFRQSFLPWVAVLFLWLAWAGWRNGRLPAALKTLGAAGLAIACLIIPFTLRNYRVYGDFLLLNSNAGYAMYSAQHPMHGTSFRAFAAAPLPEDIVPRPANEAEWDRALMRRGLEFVLADPGRYALLTLSRAADYFMFWPSGETTLLHNAGRVLSFALFMPFMVYGLWLSRAEWRRYRLLYAFMLFYTALHLLTWAMIRYRLPVDAVLMLFAALAFSRLAARLPGAAARTPLPA
jgi:hypothetical protein